MEIEHHRNSDSKEDGDIQWKEQCCNESCDKYGGVRGGRVKRNPDVAAVDNRGSNSDDEGGQTGFRDEVHEVPEKQESCDTEEAADDTGKPRNSTARKVEGGAGQGSGCRHAAGKGSCKVGDADTEHVLVHVRPFTGSTGESFRHNRVLQGGEESN